MAVFEQSYSLISHPHQSLYRHLSRVDGVSRQALAAKVLAYDFFPEGVCVEEIRRWMVYFHDFGKATAYFQYRIIEAARRENPSFEGLNSDYLNAFSKRSDMAEIRRGIEDKKLRSHATLGAFVGQVTLPNNLPLLLRAQLIEIIKRHHGHLKNFTNAEQSTEGDEGMLRQQWQMTNITDYGKITNVLGYRLPEGIETVISDYNGGFFDDVEDELPTKTILPYVQTIFLFSLLLAGDKGDLMLADGAGVGGVKLLPKGLIQVYKRETFKDVGTSGINLLREQVYQLVAQSLAEKPAEGFYSITLPTGLGKTLAAYNTAVQLQQLMADTYAKEGHDCVPRVIYCLPFTSVIDQNAQILEEILAANGLGEGLLAKHHYLADWPSRKDDQYAEEQLAHSQKEYLVEGWEYDITVTTFVQFLESIFSNRNRQLRKFHNLANAIVILDEVQSIPPKYFQAVSLLLEEIHRQMGTRFVLVTATQPFLFPTGMVYELANNAVCRTADIFQKMDRITLDLNRYLDGPDELDEQLQGFVADILVARTSSFLFIFNYVKESQEAFRYFVSNCKQNDTVFIYLSAAIVPYERKRRIAEIKQRSQTGKRTIVVSTQVVEAGVDIDLDIVYRAFAPLDSINQSAGRCNRNGKNGQPGSVRVFRQAKRGNSLYDETFLAITDKVLQEAVKEIGAKVLPERLFYELNSNYALAVRKQVAEENNASVKLIKDMRNLLFEDVNSNFNLIEQKYTRYSVFIEDEELLPGSAQVWTDFQAVFREEQDRWVRKQRLRQLRSRLLEFVVQFPAGYLPEEQEVEAMEKPLIRLSSEEYPICYDFNFGYFKADDTNDESARTINV